MGGGGGVPPVCVPTGGKSLTCLRSSRYGSTPVGSWIFITVRPDSVSSSLGGGLNLQPTGAGSEGRGGVREAESWR